MVTEDDQIVSDLRDAIRDGRSGLRYVPRLLGLVLDRDAWRERLDEHGEKHTFATFDEFAAAAPMAGLGADPEVVNRIVGTDDPDLLVKLRNARKGKRGRKPGNTAVNRGDSPSISDDQTSLTADRLARDAPDEYEAVKRGDKSINAAAVAAGIRPHRISVRLDRPESIASSLRRHLTPEQLSTLARLLLEG